MRSCNACACKLDHKLQSLPHIHWGKCRAVAKLAEDPEFHMILKLEPGDIELIHNPYVLPSHVQLTAHAPMVQCIRATLVANTPCRARGYRQNILEAKSESMHDVCQSGQAVRSKETMQGCAKTCCTELAFCAWGHMETGSGGQRAAHA